jgi:hypothetical protein
MLIGSYAFFEGSCDNFYQYVYYQTRPQLETAWQLRQSVGNRLPRGKAVGMINLMLTKNIKLKSPAWPISVEQSPLGDQAN